MLLLYLCFAALAHNALGKTINKNLELCYRSDPEINNCLTEKLKYMLKEFQNGIPELGIESIDPYHMDFMAVESDLESIKLNIVMKNITLYGLSNTKINYLKFDPKTLSGEVSYSVPNLRMTCTYFSTGRLFVIPLESSAYFDGNFTNSDATVSYKLKTKTRKGVEYFTIEKLAMKIFINRGHMKLTAINKDNQQQVSVIQDFFNENDRLVMDVTNPILYENSSKLLKYILEGYLRRVPAEVLMPN